MKTNFIQNQGTELIKDGLKDAPSKYKVLAGVGLFLFSLWGTYMIGCKFIDRKAEKDQNTAKKKSDFRKEESAQNSAQRIQESREKTNDAMNLDDHKTDNKIKIIKAKGQEEREKIILKNNLSPKTYSKVDEVVVEPTFPTSSFDAKKEVNPFLDRPSYKERGINILSGAPGTGKSRILNNFLFYRCGMLNSGLFNDEKPQQLDTCYLYDYEMGKGFNQRYHNLTPRNFHRCDMQEKATKFGDVVYTLDYLFKQIQEDLEYASGNVIMAIDCKGMIKDANKRANEFINRLKRFISDYEAKNRSSLTFILVEHLNPYSASPSTILSESKIKGSQYYNGFADQTILVGKTRVNGCVRVKIAKNRYGEEQVYTVHLFQKVDEVFFKYIGEYDENQVLLPKNGNSMSLDEFRKVVKPTSTPTFKKKSNVAGRPINLTLSVCKAILYARSQGMSKNAASSAEGFTRQAYNEALKRYGLVDNYPDGNWKP